MCGDSSPPPAPTDPFKTAAAQQQANLATTMQNQAASQTNQITPYGSSTYYQTGIGPNGIPTYTNVQQLTPQQQVLLGLSQQSAGLAGGAGANLLANTFGQYSNAPDLSSQAGGTTQQLLGQQTEYLRPYFETQNTQLDTRLRNQGIMPGTPAYDQQMDELSRRQDQSVTGFLTQAQPMAFEQAYKQYNAPLQTAATLAALGQPAGLGQSYVNAPGATGNPADLTGAVANADQQRMQAYQTAQSQQNAMMSGIFGIAGQGVKAFGPAAASAIFASDRRLKRDIERIGTWFNGLPVYRFKYRWNDTPRVGFMADEVVKVRPDAVWTVGGFAMVDYQAAMA